MLGSPNGLNNYAITASFIFVGAVVDQVPGADAAVVGVGVVAAAW